MYDFFIKDDSILKKYFKNSKNVTNIQKEFDSNRVYNEKKYKN